MRMLMNNLDPEVAKGAGPGGLRWIGKSRAGIGLRFYAIGCVSSRRWATMKRFWCSPASLLACSARTKKRRAC